MKVNDVINRIKKHAGLKNDKDIAVLLGLSAADFSNRKKRGTLLPVVLEWAVNENVNLQWLVHGEEQGQGRAAEAAQGAFPDSALLQTVIEAVEEILEERELTLRADKKAQLIVTLYEMFAEEGKKVDKPTVLRLIKLAA